MTDDTWPTGPSTPPRRHADTPDWQQDAAAPGWSAGHGWPEPDAGTADTQLATPGRYPYPPAAPPPVPYPPAAYQPQGFVPPTRPRRGALAAVAVLAAIVLVGGGVVAAWWFLGRSAPPPAPAQPPVTVAGAGSSATPAAPQSPQSPQSQPPTAGALPAGLAACPAGTNPLAWATIPGGSWAVVCGSDADRPLRWQSSLGGERQDAQQVTWDAAVGRYTATLPDGSRAWLAATPAMVGRAAGDRITYAAAADGQWFTRPDRGPETGSFGIAPPRPEARDQARYLSDLLAHSTADRTRLTDAVTAIRSCSRGGAGNYAADVAAIEEVTRNRQALLAAAETAPVDQLPDGTLLLTQLHAFVGLSVRADQAFVTWAEAINAYGCNSASDEAGRNLSDQTGTAKEAFLATWNSRIAPAYGVPTYTRAQI